MKRLLLIRHAKSDWSDDSLADFDRPLNKRGMHDAPLMAEFLSKRSIVPDHFLSSPANRALSTARLFTEHFGVREGKIICDKSLYEAFTHQILDAIARLPASAKTACIFTHNPAVTSAIAQYGTAYIANVPTCGIGHIVLEQGDWTDFIPGKAGLADLWIPKNCLDAYQ